MGLTDMVTFYSISKVLIGASVADWLASAASIQIERRLIKHKFDSRSRDILQLEDNLSKS